MNSKTKKTIAKEIIYFFSVIATLLLVWAGIEIRNSYLRNKTNNLSINISELKNQIDSIEKVYSKKEKTLEQLMGMKLSAPESLPANFDFNEKPNPFIDSPREIKISTWELSCLYQYLKENKFDFSVPGEHKTFIANNEWVNVELKEIAAFLKKYPKAEATNFFLAYEEFEKLIKKELIQNKQPYLQGIYNYIKNGDKKLNCNYASFVLCLKGLPEPPPETIVEQVKQLKKTRTEAEQNLELTSSMKLYPDETKGIVFWFSIILFGLLYPLRFIFILLKWAFKTVKQKE